eukprot:3725293-Rhodomonas_salina.1
MKCKAQARDSQADVRDDCREATSILASSSASQKIWQRRSLCQSRTSHAAEIDRPDHTPRAIISNLAEAAARIAGEIDAIGSSSWEDGPKVRTTLAVGGAYIVGTTKAARGRENGGTWSMKRAKASAESEALLAMAKSYAHCLSEFISFLLIFAKPATYPPAALGEHRFFPSQMHRAPT